MCKIQELSQTDKDYKPKYEMQDIFRLYGDDYIARHKLNSMQLKAIQDISECRTSALGYNATECNDCKNIEFAYNSCRNRNCPKCQGDKRYDWIEKRLKTTLDVPYYHTVFTVPNQLFEIGIYNQKIFYEILFKSSSDTLKLFANNLKWWDIDESLYEDKKPKIDLAFFGILHSWGQTLVYHPHIHFVVAGGAVEVEEEQTEFDVVLTSAGAKKINAIKVVRAITGLGLKEAKSAVENAPTFLKEAVSKEEAEGFKKQIEEAGASCELK